MIQAVISYSRRTVFQMAEVAVPGELFARVLTRIRNLASVPIWINRHQRLSLDER
jgi:hypothetical protein